MYSNTTVIESQVDWLTSSTHHEENTSRLRALAGAFLAHEERSGQRRHRFRLMGYQGEQCGRVRWGERGTAGLVQLSGDLAEQHLGAVRDLADTTTRLDIAVTVQLPEYDGGIAERHYREACAYRGDSQRAALPRLVADGNGGSTCYIGQRVSPYVLRVYNKEAERRDDGDAVGAEQYQRCWRYELECKGYPAPQVAQLAQDHSDRSQWIQAFVYQYAAQHGLAPAFLPDQRQALRPGFTRRADRERTLAWLHKTVAPSIARLSAAGGSADVLSALGLSTLPRS